MSQNNTNIQHFVPVCYLRNFCPKEEQGKRNPKVWAYDKLSKRPDFKGVKSICYINKLYSINKKSESLITNNISDKETIFESHFLHDFEQEYSPKLKEAITSIEERRFGGQQKIDISTFIAIQFLRDPILKELCAGDEEIPYFVLPDEYKRLSNNSPELLDDPSMRHFMYAYGNKNAITPMVRSLSLSEWTIHYNINDVFFSSDNPVCLVQDSPYKNKSTKLSILFPLSKNILIQIRQGIQINEIFFIDNTQQLQIDSFNFVQYFFAKKYVVSSTNTFDTIKDKITNYPITWDINKLNIYGKTKYADHEHRG